MEVIIDSSLILWNGQQISYGFEVIFLLKLVCIEVKESFRLFIKICDDVELYLVIIGCFHCLYLIIIIIVKVLVKQILLLKIPNNDD